MSFNRTQDNLTPNPFSSKRADHASPANTIHYIERVDQTAAKVTTVSPTPTKAYHTRQTNLYETVITYPAINRVNAKTPAKPTKLPAKETSL
jgi:hypothetical protein